ncbi:hypothetical protein JQ604_17845 [Bradyrhizobium jicamae]|uniref:hypothetical protein n=1 Tax=Bradyrhizobium jicamae TaxID=280332 RepID=UPI001BA7A2A2|nr:hypothetical protein [Bradyrhizobium jicamae]MBR0754050.1 hypothetical protein [Bradyrhizobium jicamae]
MPDPLHLSTGFFYLATLIINPPIIGGNPLVTAPDSNGNVSFTFTQPEQPCGDPECQQEIFRFEQNPDSCWVYENIALDNVNEVRGFFFAPIFTPGGFTLKSLGNVNGCVFTFRAHVSSRCAPSS